MPRPKPPPTPSASTEPTAKDRADMEATFELPPPAMHQKPPTKMSPPVSPSDKPMGSSPQRKRTLSGSHKSRDDAMQYDLPPPPSRARKIIQMKPKTGSTSSSASEPAEPTPQPAKTAGTKRKQPSATSAAGRKIARKTAHSIIERRRRSKMNEEFGVLKDMIPACEGIEMHKLAILQAGIEYVRYLEGCITQMKAEKQEQKTPENSDEEESPEPELPVQQPRRTAPSDWQYRKPSIATTDSSPISSPNILPYPYDRRLPQSSHRAILPNISHFTASPNPAPHSSTPAPTLLSPAFGAIHFSPDLSRTGTNSTQTSMGIHTASPHILPLPQAMMSLERSKNGSPATLSEGGAEATATAALMMMSSNDRRVDEGPGQEKERGRGKGMSVMDLLSA